MRCKAASSNPVEFWLAIMNETLRGANADGKAAHMLFCKTASDKGMGTPAAPTKAVTKAVTSRTEDA